MSATLRWAPNCFCRSKCPGALFSVGDTHAAQGDGEVCGTAIESPMRVALQFDLIQTDAARAFRALEPQGPSPGTWTPRVMRSRPASVPDLMEAARASVRSMVDWLMHRAWHAGDRRLHAVQRLRRPSHQRNRRLCRTGPCRSTFRASCSSENESLIACLALRYVPVVESDNHARSHS